MTLLQMKYALTIADAGSMNRAASMLYVSQPTLTSAMKELEAEVGIPIFIRTSRGVVPTSEGEEFLRYARQVYAQYELLEARYGDQRKVKRKFAVSTQHYSFVDKAFVEMVKQFDLHHFEFAIRETRTMEVILDVRNLHSEIGVLYQSDYNRMVIQKILQDNALEFHKLIECQAYVYLWRGHPLAQEEKISMTQLEEYPRLSFEQGSHSSLFLAEEIFPENEHLRSIQTSDRATMFNLMVGLNGYTLCSGIICEELNGSEYVAIPYAEDEEKQNNMIEIGYITRKGYGLSEIGRVFLQEMQRYLCKAGHQANSL